MIEGYGPGFRSVPLNRPKTYGSGSATLATGVNDNSEGSKIVNIFTIFGNDRKYEKALILG
jgi:hypothetical protein